MVFRVEKNENYTTMSNYHLREKNMSLKAKGLLSWMLSNTNDWDYSIQGIVANCKENETAIRNTLKELQEFGYLKIVKLFPESRQNEEGDVKVARNRIEYEYYVYEQPIQEGGIQDVENLALESLHLENPGQINTKERKTKKRNTNKENINKNSSFTLGQKEKSPSLFMKCSSLIEDFTDNEELKKALMDYLRVRLEIKDKPLYANSWKGLLNKLNREFSTTEEKLETVYQSIERGYASFFPVGNKKYTEGNKTAYRSEIMPYGQTLEGIPHDGRYDNEDHTRSGLIF